jgi:molybdenum-dependent DNA-binding transcriptional regulator ModE
MKNISDKDRKTILDFVRSGGTITDACKKVGIYRQLINDYPEFKRELKEAKCLTATTGRTRGRQSGLKNEVMKKHLNFEFQDFL